MSRNGRVLRAPGLHFLVLGGLLFAAHRLLVPTPLHLTPGARAESRALSDDEILFRDALAMGLDRNDPLVRARLTQLGELVAAGEVEDTEAFEQEARRLGLNRSDVVVRRHLVHAMQLALAHVGPRDWPDESELNAYFEAHRDDYVEPPRYRFRQVFFARDRHGTTAVAAAGEALEYLRDEHGRTDVVRGAGDPFLLGAALDLSQPELARRFGPQFASALQQAPTARWFGPLHSPYGEHVVWMFERTPATVPPLDAVRSRVVHAVLAARANARLDRRMQERRAAYAR